MIQNIYIKNFKALREVDIPVSCINVFTGLNGMGKSTVLQALMLLRQSKDSLKKELKLNGDLVQIENFGDCICETPTEDEIVKIELIFSGGKVLSVESQYEITKDAETILPTSYSNIQEINNSLLDENTFMYLSADRISPEDSYGTNSTAIERKQLGNKGQYAPHFYHNNKNKDIPIKELAFYPETKILSLEYQLSQWLGVISPGIRVHTKILDNLVSLKYSYKTKKGDTNEYRAKNAGFGLTYVFSVLVAILSSNKGDIVLIENTESHIHPRGQSELARLMALAAANGVQLFVETHSDHVLNGLRVAVKNNLIAPSDANIYFFYRDVNSEIYETEIKPLFLDEKGRIDEWPEGFLDEWENQLDELLS